MKIILEQSKYHRFALYYDYDQNKVNFCRDLKDGFGWDRFSFDSQGTLKRWVFSDSLFIPVIVERFPEVEIEPRVAEIVAYEQKWAKNQLEKDKEIDEIKIKTDTEFSIKGLKKELYNYQKIDVEFLVASGGRALIASEMGTGKTAITLSYIKYMGYKRSLVVCPASVKFVWEGEVKKWANLKSVVINSKTNLANIDPTVQIWIINYDILRKHFSQLSKIRFNAIVGDEAIYIKNSQSIRCKAFRTLSRDIPSVVLLSGAPLLNRPAELFSLLNVIDQKTWNNWYDFARKFCNMHQTRWGVDTSGASNIEELHARIKRYFIRRLKKDVLSELPPKIFIPIPIQLKASVAKEYNIAANNLAIYLRQYSGKQPPAIAKSMTAEKLIQLNILRQVTAMGKVDTAIELIDSIIDSGEKVLIYCSFVGPLECLKEHYRDKAVIITGKTPVKDRRDIVDAFQNNSKIQIFLGGYKSAGTGVTLTAASNFIGLDFPWSNADLFQAIDRLHRPGQKANSVNIYQISAKDTIDEDMKDMLDHKQNIFDTVIDGKVKKEKTISAMEKATERILKNY